MRVSFKHIIPALLLLFSACQREEVVPAAGDSAYNESERIDLLYTVTVHMESETRYTISDSDGRMSFSEGDEIFIYNGSKVFNGTTRSTGSTGVFFMESGFPGTGSGPVATPRALLYNWGKDQCIYSLPASYSYSSVGGTDPNSAKALCPMIGYYNAGEDVNLKVIASMLRFRITDVAAGSLIFTFPTYVSGRTSNFTTIPSGPSDGIKASDLTSSYRRKTITITGVPEVPEGSYVYITIPVPVGTVPDNIVVTNVPSDTSREPRLAGVSGTSSSLARAEGQKLNVSGFVEAPVPTFQVSATKRVAMATGNLMARISSYNINNGLATADQWRIGYFFECIGLDSADGNRSFIAGFSNDSVKGKWIDLLSWQGESATNLCQGLIRLTGGNTAYTGTDVQESLYPQCWRTQNHNAAAANGYIHINNGGTYDWRPLSAAEWSYIMYSREGSIVSGRSGSRYAGATIAGVGGMLLFPDGNTEIWDSSTMGTPPEGINGSTNNVYSATNLIAMIRAGIVFLPNVGYRNATSYGTSQCWYWSSDALGDYYYHYNTALAIPSNRIVNDGTRMMGGAVRLVRDIDASGNPVDPDPVFPTIARFSVASNKRVALAPGNLMAKIGSFTEGSYTATASEWKFGDPMEYIGGSGSSGNFGFARGYSSLCVGKWVDLFSFQGNSCSPSNRAHGLVRITNGNNSSYHGNVAGEPVYDGCWNGLPITNGGDYNWRPLTHDEWTYLFNTRTVTNTLSDGARFTMATVGGSNKGMILFPDLYIHPAGTGFVAGTFNSYSNFTATVSAEGWALMQAAGCVFLPCGGWREDTSFISVGFQGCYFTATGDGTSSAWNLNFRDGAASPSDASMRYRGMTVRLARDVN